MTNAFTIMSIVGLSFMMYLPTVSIFPKRCHFIMQANPESLLQGVMIYFISNGAIMGIQAAILRIPIVKEWANIRPPPPATELIPAPTMQETLEAGFNKFRGFNENNFKRIADNAVQKAQRDIAKREHEVRQVTKQAALAAKSKHGGAAGRRRSGR